MIKYSLNSVGNFRLFGFATGNYECKCIECGSKFIGDKRATMCLECAIKAAEEPKRLLDFDRVRESLISIFAENNFKESISAVLVNEVIDVLESGICNYESHENDFNAFESIHTTIACNSKDNSIDPRDAWIYAIVCGWKGDILDEICQQHRWNDKEKARLKQMHLQFQAAMISHQLPEKIKNTDSLTYSVLQVWKYMIQAQHSEEEFDQIDTIEAEKWRELNRKYQEVKKDLLLDCSHVAWCNPCNKFVNYSEADEENDAECTECGLSELDFSKGR